MIKRHYNTKKNIHVLNISIKKKKSLIAARFEPLYPEPLSDALPTEPWALCEEHFSIDCFKKQAFNRASSMIVGPL